MASVVNNKKQAVKRLPRTDSIKSGPGGTIALCPPAPRKEVWVLTLGVDAPPAPPEVKAPPPSARGAADTAPVPADTDTVTTEMLSGDDALVHASDLLYRTMCHDARLEQYFEGVDLAEFASQMRRLMEGVFEDEWPEMEVSQSLIDEGYDDLVDLLCDALESEVNLGADPMLSRMEKLLGDMNDDERLQRFFNCFRNMVSGDSEEPAEGKASQNDEHSKAEGGDAANAGKDAGADVNTKSFEDLVLDTAIIEAANNAWRMFISTAESREAAGEAIYAALFEGAPSLQSLFTTPRAVQAMRFMNGLASFVMSLNDPPGLKILVETLGFGHLHLDVTVPRAIIFRDAILDLFMMELAEKFTKDAREGWKRLLNYVAGALIYIKQNYAERITCLLASWKLCNVSKEDKKEAEGASGSEDAEEKMAAKVKKKTGWFGAKKTDTDQKTHSGHTGTGTTTEGSSSSMMLSNGVPTTYPEMFLFNAAVMGFGNATWMNEVLACFHNIVTNVSNSARLAEECEVLTLRIARVARGQVNFPEYKSCMLASLRSLLPKQWDGKHEVAWNWLWENVERLILRIHGQPPIWEKALAKIVGTLDADEAMKFEFRKDIYARVFTVAPASQDYFKQSNTYLHVIADKIIQMTVDLLQNPVKMVDDISSLGLRHVGYGIPTELFGPFVTACVEVLMTRTSDDTTIESFRWSLGLTSKMLVRTITEGSTIVMKAINANSQRLLRKAIQCAPRGERAQWLLLVQVGTSRISPLAWSIESGNLEAAVAMIRDLLTFRADRDRYYYGVDDLFIRHPDLIKMLCDMAPDLLPKLFDGLIWRSRNTESGLRRVNYYVKHLLINHEGGFSPAIKWITDTRDPKIVCHPVIVLVSDIVWARVAYRKFLGGKSFLLFTLLIFITAQSILKHVGGDRKGGHNETERIAIFVCRMFIYVFSMSQYIYIHLRDCIGAYRSKETFRVGCLKVPKYLKAWQDAASFCLTLTLIVMLILEPIFWCFPHQNGRMFLESCREFKGLQFPYFLVSMVAMFLFYLLLLDLTVVSTSISAFVLVCVRAVSEIGLFLGAVAATILTFSSASSVLKHDTADFAGIQHGALALVKMFLNMYKTVEYKGLRDDPKLLAVVFFFLVSTVVFLLSLLVAQLTCAYSAVYSDMVGYARLERGQIIVEVMPSVSKTRWETFVHSLRLQKRLEFNEGDIGVAGGIQVREPAGANPTTIDMIRRFGGSTSVEIQWPEEEGGDGDGDDRWERMEKLIQRTLKAVSDRSSRRSANSGTQGGSADQSDSNQNAEDGERSGDEA